MYKYIDLYNFVLSLQTAKNEIFKSPELYLILLFLANVELLRSINKNEDYISFINTKASENTRKDTFQE